MCRSPLGWNFRSADLVFFFGAWFVLRVEDSQLRLGKAWDSLVLKQLRVFTGSLEEDLVFHRRSARYLRDFGSR